MDGLEHRDAVRSVHTIKIIDDLMKKLTQRSLCSASASHLVAAVEGSPISAAAAAAVAASAASNGGASMEAVMAIEQTFVDDSAGADADQMDASGSTSDQADGRKAETGKDKKVSWSAKEVDAIVESMVMMMKTGDEAAAKAYARAALQGVLKRA